MWIDGAPGQRPPRTQVFATVSRTRDIRMVTPMTRATDRLAVIDLLRGIAASAVAWFHFTRGNPRFLPEGALRSSGAYGWLGVEVFFVISGFIIPFALYKEGYQLRLHWKRFIAKRLIRLDPPYLACIVVAVALSYASAATPGFKGEPPDFTWTQAGLHLATSTRSLAITG